MNLQFKGRNILYSYDHIIMELDLEHLPKYCSDGETSISHVNDENIRNLGGGYFSVDPMKKLMRDFDGQVEGYCLATSQSPCVAYAWIAYPKVDLRHYRIRNTEAYLFKVSTMPEYRNKGYAGDLCIKIAEELRQKGIKKVTLAVMRTNISAIRVYERIGFRIVCYKRFVRLFRTNIPYHTL